MEDDTSSNDVIAREPPAREERGLMTPYDRGNPRRVLMVHEGQPHWLGALRRTDLSSLIVWSSLQSEAGRSLWKFFEDRPRLGDCITHVSGMSSPAQDEGLCPMHSLR